MRELNAMLTCLVVLVLVIPLAAGAEPVNCLTFKIEKSKNRVKEFRKSIHHQLHSEIYSASFDLNSDGEPEYFFYVEDIWFCGMGEAGCPINVYEYVNGRFRELFEYGIYTSNQFDPTKLESGRYVCISSDKTLDWYDVLIMGRTYRYNGKQYIYDKAGK